MVFNIDEGSLLREGLCAWRGLMSRALTRHAEAIRMHVETEIREMALSFRSLDVSLNVRLRSIDVRARHVRCLVGSKNALGT
jgi:hypothetical protein